MSWGGQGETYYVLVPYSHDLREAMVGSRNNWNKGKVILILVGLGFPQGQFLVPPENCWLGISMAWTGIV